MSYRTFVPPSIVAACFILVLAGSSPVFGAIAGDSFLFGNPPDTGAGEYRASPTLDGRLTSGGAQNPTIPGFTGAWTGIETSLWQVVESGLTYGAIVGEAGGSVRHVWSSDVGARHIRRALSSPPTVATNDEFWMSLLLRVDGPDPDFDGSAWAGFASANEGTEVQGLKIGVAGDGSEMDLVYRHRIGGNTLETLTIQDGIAAGTTHLVVVKATVNTDLGGDGVIGNDNISIWVDPVNVANEAWLGTPTLEVEDWSIYNSDAFDFLVLEGADVTGAGIRFDEPFLGRSLADVVTPTPEPATFLIWSLLAGLAMGLGRRRRPG